MAASRKDKKGRVLRPGESFREKDSMYVFSYTDVLGKRKYTYSKDLAKLRKKEDEIKKDQLDGICDYAEGNADLNFIFDRYIATRHDLRTTTRANYIVTYDRYIRSSFGKRKIADIKYSDIVLFYNTLMKEKDLSIGTIQYIQRMIRPTLQMAVRDNVLRANPADGVIQLVKRTALNAEGNSRKALTLEQQRAFLKFIDENPLYERWRPLIIMMIGTGVRVGELIALKWTDIDFKNRSISIVRSLAYFSGKQNKSPSKWLLNKPKTAAGIRTIPMVDTVYDALMEEKARQERDGITCQTVVGGESGFIFYNRFFEVYVPESINREINRMIEHYNSSEEINAIREKREPIMLPHFSCHHLRHTFCTRLCEADVHIKVIQSIMGHKDIHTTLDIYSEVTEWKKKISIEEVFNNMKLF